MNNYDYISDRNPDWILRYVWACKVITTTHYSFLITHYFAPPPRAWYKLTTDCIL